MEYRKRIHIAFLAAVALLLPSGALGVDGVILIDQNKALAGNVTLGDAPGFPVSITQPGSYRLSGNLTVPDANTTAILINTGNVTVDLNGFAILGPTVCSGTPLSCAPAASGVGIGTTVNTQSNIAVHNGSVRGMRVGIFLAGSGHLVKDVRAEHNEGSGIVVGVGTVSHSTARSNGGYRD
jgi:hypothetical protein